MKRLSKNCMVLDFSELGYGWTFESQMRRNPEAKKVYPERRAELLNDALAKRINQHIKRYQKTRDVKHLERATSVAKRLKG